MTFTYSASALSTSSLFQIRREIGDVSESGSQFDDAELSYFYGQESNSVFKAAAHALEALAQKYSHKASFSADGLSVQWSQAATDATAQADRLRKAAAGRGTRTIKAYRQDGYSNDVKAGS